MRLGRRRCSPAASRGDAQVARHGLTTPPPEHVSNRSPLQYDTQENHMKRKLICLLVAGALPGLAGAASTSAQIKALQAQLNALQAQMKELRAALASQHGATGGGAAGKGAG
ncbi:DUF3138 family protein, partial [Burkholderia thailandensis]|uniref:DUF3138 family protein n=1 Tax=Burkholderia thailandensis TaxID=57975 RepID=UPI001E63E2DD